MSAICKISVYTGSFKETKQKKPRLVFTIFLNYVHSCGFSQFPVSTVLKIF